MKRGVITLSPQEIQVCLPYLPTSAADQLFYQRLSIASQEQLEEQHIQVSEDDLELILDNLPAPSKQEAPELTLARQKILAFLGSLRFTQ